jgi:hypothetical protein
LGESGESNGIPLLLRKSSSSGVQIQSRHFGR